MTTIRYLLAASFLGCIIAANYVTTRYGMVPVGFGLVATAGNDKKMNAGLIPPLIDYILEARGLNARGWAVTPDAFRPDALPPHFSMNYKLIDEHGRQLDMNRSLVALRGEWGKEAKEEFLPMLQILWI